MLRKNHSTSTALLKVTDDIRKAMDSGLVTILTLLDFSKAFDSVDHDILLSCLFKIHLSKNSIQWMDSYLRGRQQCVKINLNQMPSWRPVERGVPQGSVLGPLLFSIYINGITSSITKCKHHLYADDVQIYLHSAPEKLSEAIGTFNEDLTEICNWTRLHGLRLNEAKTQAIIISHQKILLKLKN